MTKDPWTMQNVPAQEAPRDKYPENCPLCKRGDHYAWAFTECPSETTKDGAESLKAEPQAGAQQETLLKPDCVKETANNLTQAGAQVPSREWIVADSIPEAMKILVSKLDAALAHIKVVQDYALEAAKTPITREDMHDPLKAKTFFDEAKGFERLVLSEIGGPK